MRLSQDMFSPLRLLTATSSGAGPLDPIGYEITKAGHKKKEKEAALFQAGIALLGRKTKQKNLRERRLFEDATTYRGGLIDAQSGGLMSTILNLGGAAGDPTRPYAKQAVGTVAAATEAGELTPRKWTPHETLSEFLTHRAAKQAKTLAPGLGSSTIKRPSVSR